jgi:gluconokinase
MEAGIALNDEDRWDWLVTLREAAVSALDSSQTNSTAPMQNGVVVTCSALKHKYRDVIRVAAYNDHRVHVHFIYLHASEAVLTERVRARKGHYMGANMVQSQFAVLEEPDTTECNKDVVTVDCSGSQESVASETLDRVRALLAAHSEEGW